MAEVLAGQSALLQSQIQIKAQIESSLDSKLEVFGETLRNQLMDLFREQLSGVATENVVNMAIDVSFFMSHHSNQNQIHLDSVHKMAIHFSGQISNNRRLIHLVLEFRAIINQEEMSLDPNQINSSLLKISGRDSPP